MSLKSSTNVSANTHELILEISAEDFNKAILKAYQKEKNQIQIKGFRKGKAPLQIIEKYYGEEVFFDSAINEFAGAEVFAAVEEAKLDIVDRPALEVVSASKADGVVLKAICTTRPEVNVPEYKGLKAPKVIDAVTDDVIDEQIEAARKRQARIITVEDREAKMDDEVLIDFEGFKDGVAFDGGKGEDFPLTLGSHQFIPGFEEQVVGHKTGEEFDIEVVFPTDYQMKELAGEKATFKINLKEIRTQELPEFDDEFVKDVSEFETVDEYKADLKSKLEESAQKKADAQFENYLFETIINNLEGEIPECMYDQKIDREIQEFEMRLKQSQMSLDLYFQYTGMDLDDLKATYRDRAVNEVKLRLALEKIVELENITVTEEEVENGLKEIAESNNLDVDQVKRIINVADYEMDLKVGKAADIVKEEVIQGGKVDLTDNIKNLPEDATVEVVENVSSDKVGEFIGKVKVSFANGTSREVEIPVVVKAPAKPKPWPFTDVKEIAGHWKYENVKYVYENNIMNGIAGTTLFQPDHPLTRAMFATVLYRMAGNPEVTFKNTFPDVKDGQYYTSAILWAADKKIVSGMSDGTYGVTQNITRAQIAKMLYEYAKLQKYDISGAASLDSFTDKDKVRAWAVGYLKWAVDAGMINGKPNGDGTFRLDPDGFATRAECAKMLTMFMQKYVEK